MALIILGLFVLVWIISAVVKASQDAGPNKGRPMNNRPRPVGEPRAERATETDIDRFMAEIDRLRRKGEGDRSPEPPRQSPPRPLGEPRTSSRGEARPRPSERRERERDRRPRQSQRSSPAPSSPSDSVPVLRPVSPEPPPSPPAPPESPRKQARPPRPSAASAVKTPPSPVLETLRGLLRSPQGPAAAIILAEIFGEPPGRRGTVRGPHRIEKS